MLRARRRGHRAPRRDPAPAPSTTPVGPSVRARRRASQGATADTAHGGRERRDARHPQRLGVEEHRRRDEDEPGGGVANAVARPRGPVHAGVAATTCARRARRCACVGPRRRAQGDGEDHADHLLDVVGRRVVATREQRRACAARATRPARGLAPSSTRRSRRVSRRSATMNRRSALRRPAHESRRPPPQAEIGGGGTSSSEATRSPDSCAASIPARRRRRGSRATRAP